jgi:hypothetical protein
MSPTAHVRAEAQRIREQTRTEQGLSPRISDRRTLERVAALLSSATPDGTGPRRNGSVRDGQARPQHARAPR